MGLVQPPTRLVYHRVIVLFHGPHENPRRALRSQDKIGENAMAMLFGGSSVQSGPLVGTGL